MNNIGTGTCPIQWGVDGQSGARSSREHNWATNALQSTGETVQRVMWPR